VNEQRSKGLPGKAEDKVKILQQHCSDYYDELARELGPLPHIEHLTISVSTPQKLIYRIYDPLRRLMRPLSALSKNTKRRD
jgi:hypothetical protein